LLGVASICALTGILILTFLTEYVSLGNSDINSINESLVDQKVVIKGYITSLRDTPSVLLLDVEDKTGKIKVVAFKEGNITLEKGSIIGVEGTVSEYKNGLEILATEITRFT